MIMICNVPDEVVESVKMGTWCGSSVAEKMIAKGIPLDKIRAEITDCLKALDEIEKSGFNIYLPNEMSGRRLTYQQCLGFIDKYKIETEKA